MGKRIKEKKWECHSWQYAVPNGMFFYFLLTTPAKKDDLFDFRSLVTFRHTAAKIDKVVGNLSLMINGNATADNMQFQMACLFIFC